MKRSDLIEQQKKMASQVIVEDRISSLEWIGGMDVSNSLYDPKKMLYASCVVSSLSDRRVVEKAEVAEVETLPYITGLLAFREAPALMRAFEKLKQKPDLIMVDGHGICHPRGLGIASHIGVMLDIPTIGVAKSMLVGEAVGSLGSEAWSEVPIEYLGKQVAVLLRTKANTNPLIISSGHRVSLETAVSLVKKMHAGYRLPEPTRQAHIAANQLRCRRGRTLDGPLQRQQKPS